MIVRFEKDDSVVEEARGEGPKSRRLGDKCCRLIVSEVGFFV